MQRKRKISHPPHPYLSRGEKDKTQPLLVKLLTSWKDADPDIPILKEAKAEYARLK